MAAFSTNPFVNAVTDMRVICFSRMSLYDVLKEPRGKKLLKSFVSKSRNHSSASKKIKLERKTGSTYVSQILSTLFCYRERMLYDWMKYSWDVHRAVLHIVHDRVKTGTQTSRETNVSPAIKKLQEFLNYQFENFPCKCAQCFGLLNRHKALMTKSDGNSIQQCATCLCPYTNDPDHCYWQIEENEPIPPGFCHYKTPDGIEVCLEFRCCAACYQPNALCQWRESHALIQDMPEHEAQVLVGIGKFICNRCFLKKTQRKRFIEGPLQMVRNKNTNILPSMPRYINKPRGGSLLSGAFGAARVAQNAANVVTRNLKKMVDRRLEQAMCNVQEGKGAPKEIIKACKSVFGRTKSLVKTLSEK